MKEIRDFLMFEFEMGGEKFEMDVEAALDLTDTYNSINTMATKIDILEKVVAYLEFDLNEAEADLEAFVASKYPDAIKYVGKAKENILKIVQGDEDWRNWTRLVNIKRRKLRIAVGHLGSLKRASYLLEVKRNDLRKHPDLGDETAYMSQRKFPIKKKNKRTPVS